MGYCFCSVGTLRASWTSMSGQMEQRRRDEEKSWDNLYVELLQYSTVPTHRRIVETSSRPFSASCESLFSRFLVFSLEASKHQFHVMPPQHPRRG